MDYKMQYLQKIIASILFLFILSNPILSQSIEDLENFFKQNADFILLKAHKNATLKYVDVKVTDSYDVKYDFKIIITIKYKGFIKEHSLKCYIYFQGAPLKFIWGEDTNFFKLNTNEEQVLEELQEKWRIYDAN